VSPLCRFAPDLSSQILELRDDLGVGRQLVIADAEIAQLLTHVHRELHVRFDAVLTDQRLRP
jgi:hypothetical protein